MEKEKNSKELSGLNNLSGSDVGTLMTGIVFLVFLALCFSESLVNLIQLASLVNWVVTIVIALFTILLGFLMFFGALKNS